MWLENLTRIIDIISNENLHQKDIKIGIALKNVTPRIVKMFKTKCKEIKFSIIMFIHVEINII